jgi:hypothetical protein
MWFVDYLQEQEMPMVIEAPPARPGSNPEVAAQFASTYDMITSQTDTLFIDTEAFLDEIIVAALKEYPAISLFLLVDLAAARVVNLIKARRNLLAIYFGGGQGPPLAPHYKSFSKDATTCGFDGFVDGDDDFILGKTLYGSTLLAREAARDAATRPVFYSRFFPKLLSKLQTSAPRGPVEVTVMHPLFRRYTRVLPPTDASTAETTITDILHHNHVILNTTPSELGSGAHVTEGFDIAEIGNQFILVWEGCMRRAVTRGRASRIEMHTARYSHRGEFALIATLLKYFVLDQDVTVRPFQDVGVTFHYGSTSTTQQTVLSVRDVYSFLREDVDNALAWWIAINGTDYWHGMAPDRRGTRPPQELLSLITNTDAKFAVVTARGDVHIKPHVFEKALQKSFLKRTEYQRVDTTEPPPKEVQIQRAIDVYYGALLPDITKLPTTTFTEAVRFKSHTNLMRFLQDKGVSSTVAGHAIRDHPFAGDVHTVQARRRAAMVGWTLALMLHGHTRGFSSAQPPSTVGDGVVALPPDIVVALDPYFPYVEAPGEATPPSNPPSKTYDLTTDSHLGALLRDVGSEDTIPRVVAEFGALEYTLVIVGAPATRDPVDVTLSKGLDALVKRVPLFLDVNIATSAALVSRLTSAELCPEERDAANLLIQMPQRLAPLAADKLAALERANLGWVTDFSDVWIDESTEMNGDAYLCLVHTWGISLARLHSFEPASISGGEIGPQVSKSGARPSFVVHVPLFAPDTDTEHAVKYLEGLTGGERMTGREAWTKSDRRPTVGALDVGFMQLDLHDRAETSRIVSGMPEVCDYALPRLARDAGSEENAKLVRSIASVWTVPMLAAWMGVIRWRIAYDIFTRELLATRRATMAAISTSTASAILPINAQPESGAARGLELPPPKPARRKPDGEIGGLGGRCPPRPLGGSGEAASPPPRVKFTDTPTVVPVEGREEVRGVRLLPVSRDGEVYLETARFETWVFALYHYLFTPAELAQRLDQNQHSLLDTVVEYELVLRNLAIALPISDGVSVSITKDSVGVFLDGWSAEAARHYTEYVYKAQVEPRLTEITELAPAVENARKGPRTLEFVLPPGPMGAGHRVPVNIYHVT